MIYFSLINLGLGGGGPACREAGTTWSKGNKTRLGYWSRAPVIVGSNPTRPTSAYPCSGQDSCFFAQWGWINAALVLLSRSVSCICLTLTNRGCVFRGFGPWAEYPLRSVVLLLF